MRTRMIVALLLGLALAAVSLPVWAQDEEATPPAEEESKELNFAGVPYPYYGADTGAGLGFSIMFRNLFESDGRDATFTAGYTESGKQYYSVAWQEPRFGNENGRLSLSGGYNQEIGVRFFGIGNDSDVDDACYWAMIDRSAGVTYSYRFPRTDLGIVGMRVGAGWYSIDPVDSKLDLDEEEEVDSPPISKMFPELFDSEYFEPAQIVTVSFSTYLDTREDRFPLGGGREEVIWPNKGTYFEFGYTRSEEALGSDFTYNQFSLDGRLYLSLLPDTIVAVRGYANVMDGDVPFYKLTSGSTRGYYGNRYVDKNATILNVELRQGIAPDWELSILDGRLRAYYPSIALFWEEGRVYDDYTTVMEHMWEDYHYTYGAGLRVVVTPTLVLRADYAISAEQTTTTLTASLPF